jgi:hypothetical protein
MTVAIWSRRSQRRNSPKHSAVGYPVGRAAFNRVHCRPCSSACRDRHQRRHRHARYGRRDDGRVCKSVFLWDVKLVNERTADLHCVSTAASWVTCGSFQRRPIYIRTLIRAARPSEDLEEVCQLVRGYRRSSGACPCTTWAGRGISAWAVSTDRRQPYPRGEPRGGSGSESHGLTCNIIG